MQPLVSLVVRDAQRTFQPGDELEAQYQIDSVDPRETQAVEASVLWYTEGKGDEDMTVHFFQRRVPADAADGDLRAVHVFRSQLPNSPLSYAGVIVKVRWCVRLRLFLRRGREICVEAPFRLGNLPAAVPLDAPQSRETLWREDEPHTAAPAAPKRRATAAEPTQSS